MKVMFLSHHYASPKILLDSILKMTPGCSGKWKDMEATLNKDEADIFVALDGVAPIDCPPERTVYFGQHPMCSNGYKSLEGIKCLAKFPMSEYPNPGEWWIRHTYDELTRLEPMTKTKRACCVMTYQTHNAMYSQRPIFMREFFKDGNNLVDLYGRPEERFKTDEVLSQHYKGVLGFKNPDGRLGEHIVGKEVIGDYKYTIEFDVGPTINYWSERFYDSLLLWCMPIYFGSSNVHHWLPVKSFYYFDANNLNNVNLIKEIVSSEVQEECLDHIREARWLLLNKYQLWPYVYNKIMEVLTAYENPTKSK